MRKYLGLMFGIFFLVLLVGCKQQTAVVATFSDVEVGQTSITLSVHVDDPNQEITGTVVAKIIRPDGTIYNEKDVAIDEEYFGLNFTSLQNAVTYKIEIHATIGRNSLIIGSESYTTLTTEIIHITTPEQFLDMNLNRAGNYVLDNDLDFTDVEFISPFTSSFSGTFDGQGHTIANVTFTKIETFHTGLFGYVSSGKIQNLNLDNIQMGTETVPLIKTTTSSGVGLLAGYVSSSTAVIKNITITNSNIYYTASNYTQAHVGAVVGELKGSLSQVDVSNVNIVLTATLHGKIKMGGVVGLLSDDATLKEVSTNAQLTFVMAGNLIKNKDISINIGGVIGDNHAINRSKSVENIASSSDIDVNLDFGTAPLTTTANYAVYVGGLVGFSSSNITHAFYNGSISLTHDKNANETAVNKTFFVGGLFGYYGSRYKENLQIVRLGNGKTIDVTISDDVILKASQTLGGTNTTVAQTVGIYGDTYLMVNAASEVASDTSTVYTDLTDYFTSDWIQDAFDLANIPG